MELNSANDSANDNVNDKAREPTHKFNLYPHQVEALKLTKGKTRVAYYYDMGLGKSYIGSEKAVDLLNTEITKILCVCQKSKINDWLHQFKDNYEIKVYNLCEDTKEFIQNTGGVGNKYAVGIINYDLLIRRQGLKYLTNFVLLLDESSLIQNNKSARCKFVLSMRPSAVILLSGTPSSGYEKLWSQCKLLGWDIYKKDFDERYCNYDLVDFHKTPYPIKVLNKNNPYKNVEELKEKLREHGAIFKKTEEVIDLPKQIFTDIKVDRTKEYEIFLKERIVKIDLNSENLGDIELVGDHAFKNYLYKRKLCSVLNKDKLNALKDLLESTDERVVIFYNFNDELNAIKDVCEKLEKPISEMNGHIKDLTNYETNKSTIILCQFMSAAKGLNLQLANRMIFFTPTDKSEDYEQSIKRIHRIGQVNSCFYYRLIVRDSIEEKMYESLEKKQDYNYKLFEEEQ